VSDARPLVGSCFAAPAKAGIAAKIKANWTALFIVSPSWRLGWPPSPTEERAKRVSVNPGT
jgi:hypothetical protein